MRLTKKMADNGRYYLSGLAEVRNYYPKGYGRIQVGHAVEHLAEYEDLEEQGKLLKLPCAVGDTVYTLNALPNGKTVIRETTADAFMCALCMLEGRFGKTIFLTAEEAEAALEMMKTKS